MAPSDIATMDDVEVEDIPKTYWLPENAYIALKWIALLGLPAVGTFYQSLAGIWGLPLADEVGQTCSLAALLIGVLIGASSLKNQLSK